MALKGQSHENISPDESYLTLKGQSHENISPDENIFNKNQGLYTKRKIHRICKTNSKRFYKQL